MQKISAPIRSVAQNQNPTGMPLADITAIMAIIFTGKRDMPTIITHAAVPLCLGAGLGLRIIPPRLLLTGVVLAMLPDADVLAFKFGIAYGNAFGHRGFTHSLAFAFIVPLLCVLAARRWFRVGLVRSWLFLTVSLLSHSLLDSITTGGKGVGWLWPWFDERFFAPWQVIKVAPFALRKYATPYGHQVIMSELLWVWLPGAVLALSLWIYRSAIHNTKD